MALSREKAKKPNKDALLKSSKPVAKAAKVEKKPVAVKRRKLAGSAANLPPLEGVPLTAKKGAPAVEKTAKVKPVAVQQPAAPAKGKSAQVIAKAKAALKSEKTVAEAAVPPSTSAAAVVTPKPKAKSARKILMEASANEAASALAAKWASLYKKAEQIDAKPYNMKAIFEEKTAIVHKVLGWGYILANRNDRLEVLFKDGIKHLISNYKP